MDYALNIKNLFREIASQRSYSRLYPIVRVIMAILMLPFIIEAVYASAIYYVLLFLRNGCRISADELEAWVKRKKEGVHFIPEAVIYFVTMPFIFCCRILLTVFSVFLYFTWFNIMLFFYIATLGGIRWQPCLNDTDFESEYVWAFKHSNMTFNIFAFVNIGFVCLCLIQGLLKGAAPDLWLGLLTLAMIYIVYPKIFSKKDLRKMNSPEEIYHMALAYGEMKCLANYDRAVALLKTIPDYQNASELIVEYSSYVTEKKCTKDKIGRVLMIILATLVVALAIVPPVVDRIEMAIENNRDDHKENTNSNTNNNDTNDSGTDGSLHLFYEELSNGSYGVMCLNYDVTNVKIEASYNGKAVTELSKYAFDGCQDLRTIEIPKSVTYIGGYSFRNCDSLEEIIFRGTRTQWRNITKATNWATGAGDFVITCTDGVIYP